MELFESILIAETARQIGRGNLPAIMEGPAIRPRVDVQCLNLRTVLG